MPGAVREAKVTKGSRTLTELIVFQIVSLVGQEHPPAAPGATRRAPKGGALLSGEEG